MMSEGQDLLIYRMLLWLVDCAVCFGLVLNSSV